MGTPPALNQRVVRFFTCGETSPPFFFLLPPVGTSRKAVSHFNVSFMAWVLIPDHVCKLPWLQADAALDHFGIGGEEVLKVEGAGE
jgi:hypothetical protein